MLSIQHDISDILIRVEMSGKSLLLLQERKGAVRDFQSLGYIWYCL